MRRPHEFGQRGGLAPHRLGRTAARCAPRCWRATRGFFAARKVMEVDTPVLVNAAVTDPHLHAVVVDVTGGVPGHAGAPARMFLHTSPEYAMKRLLAAGSGDIYQICHVVRGFERSRLHNSEFTLIEWYRLGFDLPRLMGEVEDLVRELCPAHPALRHPGVRLAYRELFRRHTAPGPSGGRAPRPACRRSHRWARPGRRGARDELLDRSWARSSARRSDTRR